MKKKLYIVAVVVGFGVSILGHSFTNQEDERPVENTAYTNIVVNEYEAVSECFETPFK